MRAIHHNILLLLLLFPLLATTQTTLHLADLTPNQKIIVSAKEGNVNGIREALVSGADVNLKSIDYGMTALHYSANGGYINVATMLIDVGAADLNIKDNEYQTPLMLAATRQASVSVAQLLIAKGADVDMTDSACFLRFLQSFLSWIMCCNSHCSLTVLVRSFTLSLSSFSFLSFLFPLYRQWHDSTHVGNNAQE